MIWYIHVPLWVLILLMSLYTVALSCSCMQVENPSQQPDASIDTVYSLVVSVKSSSPTHEVYIDAHFHYTALKVNIVAIPQSYP